jgi:putative transposase
LVTYYVLFFIHLESRHGSLAGITRHPDQAWMQQMARNATGKAWGSLDQRRYALHDREVLLAIPGDADGRGIKLIQLQARSPNLHAYAERQAFWRSCLSSPCSFRGVCHCRRIFGIETQGIQEHSKRSDMAAQRCSSRDMPI